VCTIHLSRVDPDPPPPPGRHAIRWVTISPRGGSALERRQRQARHGARRHPLDAGGGRGTRRPRAPVVRPEHAGRHRTDRDRGLRRARGRRRLLPVRVCPRVGPARRRCDRYRGDGRTPGSPDPPGEPASGPRSSRAFASRRPAAARSRRWRRRRSPSASSAGSAVARR
jgi:hypothetical protein